MNNKLCWLNWCKLSYISRLAIHFFNFLMEKWERLVADEFCYQFWLLEILDIDIFGVSWGIFAYSLEEFLLVGIDAMNGIFSLSFIQLLLKQCLGVSMLIPILFSQKLSLIMGTLLIIGLWISYKKQLINITKIINFLQQNFDGLSLPLPLGVTFIHKCFYLLWFALEITLFKELVEGVVVVSVEHYFYLEFDEEVLVVDEVVYSFMDVEDDGFHYL